ncbi:MAG TPA: hypothetical protein VH593_33525 [Ktedonobacteraceae bacterium]|jgi:hypothetical protein
MKHKKILQLGITSLFTLLLLVTLTLPVHAASSKKAVIRYPKVDPNAINIYLTISGMQQQFQQSIQQQLPDQFNQSVMAQTKGLDPATQSLANQLIGEVFQPSANLTQLTPTQGGLVSSISVSLFPNDPNPLGFSMLLSFNKINSHAAEVDASAVPGQPAPPSTGPQSTFDVGTFGTLNSIVPTPGCGDSALLMNMDTAPGAAQQGGGGGQGAGFPLFIDVPAAAFQAGAAGQGNMDIGGGFSAQNIQVSLQGQGMVVNTQIAFLGNQVGSTMTTVQLSAANGKLVGTVTNTNVNIGGFLSLPVDAFNQDIQQQLNQQLGTMMGNMLNVTSVNFGPTAAVPCATPGDMLLGGTAAGGI